MFLYSFKFLLVMNYLSEMTENQTLVIYSGHPMGLFPSSVSAPRCVITNGMVIPNYSSKEDYEKYFALGTSMYGQMTAGSYCYIGPQGIVHGTYVLIFIFSFRHAILRIRSNVEFLSLSLSLSLFLLAS